MEPAGKSAAPELFSIGVLGAGIGGLTTALALREAGFGDIHVYEAGAAGAGSDTGLSLAPNATRVLHALGLKDELRSHSSHPQAHLQRTWRRGFLLAQRPLGQFSEARYGAPHIIIGHATLLGMLLKSCAEHGVAISDNRGCTGVSQANGRVLAAFDDQPLRIFSSPLDWLRGSGNGAAVVDWDCHLPFHLWARRLLVDDQDLGDRLSRALRAPPVAYQIRKLAA